MPVVKALKSFQGTKEEGFVNRGSELTVDDERHRALAKNGLVTQPEAKKAPEPDNKMAPEPENKAITHDTLRHKTIPLDDPKAAEKLVESAKDSRLPLAGGETGAGNAPSSSEQAPPPRPRASNARRRKPAS